MTQNQLDSLSKVDLSIQLLREHQPRQDYYLAFSGGKDSILIYDLARRAGSRFQAYYHSSPIDPPMMPRFIRENYPDVIFEKPTEKFWEVFLRKGPPYRNRRWCCDLIKERYGKGRLVVTGRRSEESSNRSKALFIDTAWNDPNQDILNPILLWSKEEVWDYIHSRHLPYPDLYDKGFKRIGCIMCPMASSEQRWKEYSYFHRTGLIWEYYFDKLYELKRDKYEATWISGHDMFLWWMAPYQPKVSDLQLRLFEEEDDV